MRPISPLACLLALPLCLAAAPAPAQACGAPEGECRTADGSYRLALPEEPEGGSVPAIVYLHGLGGSSARVMKNTAMRTTLAARGYALIVPEGIISVPGQTRRRWGIRNGRAHPRDDIAFLAQVLDDAALHGVDRNRILLTGFSVGGSMVWDTACHAPRTARAYASIAGAFWKPLPGGCQGPVDMFHTHGWTDRVVPIEGRSVAGGTLTQGDAFASLAILRETLGCDPHMPDAAPVEEEGGYWLRSWSNCPSGRIDLMLHPGGHGTPKDWLTRALDWFETRLAGE